MSIDYFFGIIVKNHLKKVNSSKKMKKQVGLNFNKWFIND